LRERNLIRFNNAFSLEVSYVFPSGRDFFVKVSFIEISNVLSLFVSKTKYKLSLNAIKTKAMILGTLRSISGLKCDVPQFSLKIQPYLLQTQWSI